MSPCGVCALVLAAGLSTRMGPLLRGSSKALCVLEGASLLDRCYALFKQSGIERVYVVTGHDHDKVAQRVSALGAVAVYNEQYTEGMFSSVTAGLATLAAHGGSEAFFLLPVDIPLISPSILDTLIQRWQKLGPEREEAILLPVVKDEPGHPPLIGRAHWPGILAWEGEGGLQGYIARVKDVGFQKRPCVFTVAVKETAVLWDIDTPHDLQQARQFVKNGGV